MRLLSRSRVLKPICEVRQGCPNFLQLGPNLTDVIVPEGQQLLLNFFAEEYKLVLSGTSHRFEAKSLLCDGFCARIHSQHIKPRRQMS